MAGQALGRVKNFVFSLKNVQAEGKVDPELSALIAASLAEFSRNMADDFNVSGALGVMFDLIHEINPRLNALNREEAAAVLAYVEKLNTVLGILGQGDAGPLAADIEEKIALREKARKEKDFARADAIRAELKKQGITLLDTPGGVKWKKE